jgi:lysophospholipase L1-like esterase
MVGLTLLALVALDLALRVLVPEPAARSREGDATPRRQADALQGQPWVDAYFREFHASRELRWEPYLYWRRPARSGELINVDARGLRRTWNPPLPEGAPRVFMFGGSTLWGTGARDEHTIASEISRLLHQGGRPVQVTNFAETGYVSTQGVLALLLALRAGEVPDVVVFYDGVNDVASALQSGVAGLPQNEDNRRAEFNLSRRRGSLLLGFAQRSLQGVEALRAWLSARRPAVPPEPAGGLADELVGVYAANLALVRSLGAAYGFDARFYWQPTVYAKSDPSTYERQLQEQAPQRRALFHAAEQALAASAALRGEPRFRDLTRSFDGVKEPLYIDFCHLAEAGNARMAELIAADLAQDLERRAARQPIPEASRE